jgi:hypothetical protein
VCYNPKSTPLVISFELMSTQNLSSAKDRTFMADKLYCKAVGSLLHAANTTCPNIAYSVNHLAAFLKNPGPMHWKAIQHLLTYLKGMFDYKITYH